jgi:hypothetical protein
VAYNETFWVVVGTAAPVIGLGAVLGVYQSASLGAHALRSGSKRRELQAMFIGYMLAACLASELIAFYFAIDSLAVQRDNAPISLVEYLTAGGFALLVLGGPSALALDELNRRMDDEAPEKFELPSQVKPVNPPTEQQAP